MNNENKKNFCDEIKNPNEIIRYYTFLRNNQRRPIDSACKRKKK